MNRASKIIKLIENDSDALMKCDKCGFTAKGSEFEDQDDLEAPYTCKECGSTDISYAKSEEE